MKRAIVFTQIGIGTIRYTAFFIHTISIPYLFMKVYVTARPFAHSYARILRRFPLIDRQSHPLEHLIRL